MRICSMRGRRRSLYWSSTTTTSMGIGFVLPRMSVGMSVMSPMSMEIVIVMGLVMVMGMILLLGDGYCNGKGG